MAVPWRFIGGGVAIAAVVIGLPLAVVQCVRPTGQVPVAAAPRAVPALTQATAQLHEAQAANTRDLTQTTHTIERITENHVTRVERAAPGDAGRVERWGAFRDGVHASVAAGGYAMDSVPGRPVPADAPDLPASP